MKEFLKTFSIGALHYFGALVSQMWRKHFNKLLFGVLILGVGLGFFSQKDLNLGIVFFAFVSFGLMLRNQHQRNIFAEKE